MEKEVKIQRILRAGVVLGLFAFLWMAQEKSTELPVIREQKAGMSEVMQQQPAKVGEVEQDTVEMEVSEKTFSETEALTVGFKVPMEEKSVLMVENIRKENELSGLQKDLEAMIADAEGEWSIYVKDLSTGHTISINPQEMYAASLIKLFVMESSFYHMDELIENAGVYNGDPAVGKEQIAETLAAMITVSDNEAYNEMVRLHSNQHSFTEGCRSVEEYIEENDYDHTEIYSTLWPSSTAFETRDANGNNHTSVIDCAYLLEDIYYGRCVSKKASKEMLELLLQQQVVHKIPAGIPEGVKVANKTGETDEVQHDVAIVFGPKTDYIICVMSSDLTYAWEDATLIPKISARVYEELES